MPAAAKPTDVENKLKLASLSLSTERSVAPPIAGNAMRNEKRAASFPAIPRTKAIAMVEPLRLMPGRIAQP